MEYALKTVLREAEIWTIGNNKKKNRPISRTLYLFNACYYLL